MNVPTGHGAHVDCPSAAATYPASQSLHVDDPDNN
jgi:hypothetical protein